MPDVTYDFLLLTENLTFRSVHSYGYSLHLADEDVIYPWVIRYQYKIGKDTYYGQSHWFWFKPLVSKGTPIKVTIDPQNPERSIVAAWES